ncbi:MAG: tol-pal system YbgF family protein [Thermoplasmatota archaeon]|nr:hypothetical protein [Halobacteriales archaeon]
MRWTLASAICLLLAVQGVAAGAFDGLTAGRVSSDGALVSTGPLQALSVDLFDSAQVAPQGVKITGASVDVAVDHQDANHTVVGANLDSVSWTSHASFEATTLEPSRTGDRLLLFAVPVPGKAAPTVSVTAASGAASPPVKKSIDQRTIVPGAHKALAADVSRSVVSAGDGVEVTVKGNFQVSIWDLDLSDASGRMVETGSHAKVVAAEPTGTVRGVEESHNGQAYLTVRDGQLTFRLATLQEGVLYLASASVQSTSQIVFSDTKGKLDLARPIDVDGESLTLDGHLTTTLTATPDGRLAAAVAGEPDAATLAARALELAGPSGFGWGLTLLLAAPAVAGGGWAVRRQGKRQFRRLEHAMERADYQAVLRLREPILGRRFVAQTAVIRTMALLQLGRTKDASRALKRWPRSAFPWDRDYLLAHMHAMQGQWVEASDRLRSCVQQFPSMAKAVAANPVFAPLFPADRPKTSGLREGYA